MPLLIPYNKLPDLGALEPTDYVPGLRAPFEEGKMYVSDIIYAVQPFTKIIGNITQTGSLSAPVLNIFENNTGATLSASYGGTGAYQIISDLPIFEENLIWVYIGNNQSNNSSYVYLFKWIDNYNMVIYTYDNGSLADSIMSNTSFEIRIYPNPAP